MTQSPELSITKSSPTTVSSSGETINYTITVTNEGNQTLTNVTVGDGFVSNAGLRSGCIGGPGGTVTCTASHDVTQLEIDGGGPIVNTATADQPDADADAVEDGDTELSIGGPGSVNYEFLVTNTGNVTLTNGR
ncbi:MAG: hypothetical protein R3D57_06840 [Hyphomicrobiaceae bacterium]